MQITIDLDESTANQIKKHFGTNNNKIIKESAQEIIDRYLHVEYLDAEQAMRDEIKTLK